MHLAEAHTKVGLLGVKVWICNGEVFGKRDLSPNIGARNAKSKSLKRKTKKKKLVYYFITIFEQCYNRKGPNSGEPRREE